MGHPLFTLITVAFILSGCTRTVGTFSVASEKYIAPGSVDYSKAEKIYSNGTSSHWTFYIWDILPLASIQEALNQAVRKVDGDFITNATITETDASCILFGKKTLRVEGTVYRLSKERTK